MSFYETDTLIKRNIYPLMESFDTAAVVILTYSMPLEREKNRKGMKSELVVKNKNTVPCSEGN